MDLLFDFFLLHVSEEPPGEESFPLARLQNGVVPESLVVQLLLHYVRLHVFLKGQGLIRILRCGSDSVDQVGLKLVSRGVELEVLCLDLGPVEVSGKGPALSLLEHVKRGIRLL